MAPFTAFQFLLDHPHSPRLLRFPLGSWRSSPPKHLPRTISFPFLALHVLRSTNQSLQSPSGFLSGLLRTRFLGHPSVIGKRLDQETISASDVGFRYSVSGLFSCFRSANTFRLLLAFEYKVTKHHARKFPPLHRSLREYGGALQVSCS